MILTGRPTSGKSTAYANLRKKGRMKDFVFIDHAGMKEKLGKDGGKKKLFEELKVIAKAGMKLDLNAKGLSKPCAMQCPSDWVAIEAKKLGINFLVGSDAHRAGDLEKGLDVVEELSRLR